MTERQRRAGQELADVLELAHAGHRIADPAHARNSRAAGRPGDGTAARPARRRCDWWYGRTPSAQAGHRTSNTEITDQAEHQHVERAPALWTSTLSITTWKNSGVTRAKSCRKSEATSASPSRDRKRTIDGMNQVRSKGRAAPTVRSRVVKRISSPVQRSSNAARCSITGRLAAKSCKRTRSVAAVANSAKEPSLSSAIAGSDAFSSRSDRNALAARLYSPSA